KIKSPKLWRKAHFLEITELINNISCVFGSSKKSLKLLLLTGAIEKRIFCPHCQLEKMELIVDRSQRNGVIYRCNNSRCKTKRSLYFGFRTRLPILPIEKIMHAAYLYSLRLGNYQAAILARISETAYIQLKTNFIESLLFSHDDQLKINGSGLAVQIDETACNRRRLITSPTTEEAIVRGTKWVIGVICETTRKIRLAVLEDRTVESIQEFIEGNIHNGTLIKSDGFASYPRAVENAHCFHRIVNHTQGFCEADGTNTNLIENLWSHLKTDIRTKRGIMFSKLSEFVKEWSLYYNLVPRKTRTCIDSFFLEIIKNL
ncbi:MAG: transposase, partial [Culicoidibacterales bacterium]